MAVVGTLWGCVAPSARRHGYVEMSVTCSWYTCHEYTHTQGERHAADVVVAWMPVLSRTEFERTALVEHWPPLLPASNAHAPVGVAVPRRGNKATRETPQPGSACR